MNTKYDWSKAKEWAKYIAMDKNGSFYQFKEEPKKDHECWYLDDYGDNSCYTFSMCYADFDGDWKDSLEERPNEH